MFEIEKCIFNTQKRLGSIENIFHINQNYLSVTVPHPLSPITMASIKKVFSIFFAQSLKKESRAFINIINLRSIRCVAPHRCEFVQIPCTAHSPPSHFYVALYTPPIDGQSGIKPLVCVPDQNSTTNSNKLLIFVCVAIHNGSMIIKIESHNQTHFNHGNIQVFRNVIVFQIDVAFSRTELNQSSRYNVIQTV